MWEKEAHRKDYPPYHGGRGHMLLVKLSSVSATIFVFPYGTFQIRRSSEPFAGCLLCTRSRRVLRRQRVPRGNPHGACTLARDLGSATHVVWMSRTLANSGHADPGESLGKPQHRCQQLVTWGHAARPAWFCSKSITSPLNSPCATRGKAKPFARR